MIPRLLHKAYAMLNGYFWLPCPRCGRMFGGHETSPFSDTELVDGRSMIVCPKCSQQAMHNSGGGE